MPRRKENTTPTLGRHGQPAVSVASQARETPNRGTRPRYDAKAMEFATRGSANAKIYGLGGCCLAWPDTHETTKDEHFRFENTSRIEHVCTTAVFRCIFKSSPSRLRHKGVNPKRPSTRQRQKQTICLYCRVMEPLRQQLPSQIEVSGAENKSAMPPSLWSRELTLPNPSPTQKLATCSRRPLRSGISIRAALPFSFPRACSSAWTILSLDLVDQGR